MLLIEISCTFEFVCENYNVVIQIIQRGKRKQSVMCRAFSASILTRLRSVASVSIGMPEEFDRNSSAELFFFSKSVVTFVRTTRTTIARVRTVRKCSVIFRKKTKRRVFVIRMAGTEDLT